MGGANSLRCILTTSDNGDCLCLGLEGVGLMTFLCLLDDVLLDEVDALRGLRALYVMIG